MRIYISGPITGDPDYKDHFNQAERELVSEGWEVVNPATAFDERGMTYEQIIKVDLALLESCSHIYMLPGWTKSKGARLEHAFAEAMGLKPIYWMGVQNE